MPRDGGGLDDRGTSLIRKPAGRLPATAREKDARKAAKNPRSSSWEVEGRAAKHVLAVMSLACASANTPFSDASVSAACGRKSASLE